MTQLTELDEGQKGALVYLNFMHLYWTDATDPRPWFQSVNHEASAKTLGPLGLSEMEPARFVRGSTWRFRLTDEGHRLAGELREEAESYRQEASR